MTAYTKSKERSQINDLMIHLKLLEKQGAAKPKTSRKREIIKIRAKINKLETKKPYKNQRNKKSCFFGKNKQD
jgi:hypothetical protein